MGVHSKTGTLPTTMTRAEFTQFPASELTDSLLPIGITFARQEKWVVLTRDQYTELVKLAGITTEMLHVEDNSSDI